MKRFCVSDHAVERYTERVQAGASSLEARMALGRLIALGRVRVTPRHWMREGVKPAPNLRFVYWSGQPHVCAVVRDDVVVTVLTRTLCSRSAHPRHASRRAVAITSV